MDGFDIIEFDPLHSRTAGSYVESILIHSNQVVNKAIVHDKTNINKTISTNINGTVSQKRSLESDTDADTPTKLKPNDNRSNSFLNSVIQIQR